MAITKVEYYVNDVKVGEKISAPFNEFDYTFTGVGATYDVYAKLFSDGIYQKSTPTITLNCVEPVNLDPDYVAVLDYATANSIPLPTAEQQTIDSDLLVAYKATGAWDRDDVFLKFKGTADPAFKLIDWKRLVSVTPVGGVAWDVDGLIGNSTNAYIQTLYTPSAHSVNATAASSSLLWNNKDTNMGTQAYSCIACAKGAAANYVLVRPGDKYAVVNSTATGGIVASPYNKAGFNYVTRLANALKANGQSLTQTTHGLADGPLNLMVMDTGAGPTATTFWGGTVGYAIFGADKFDIITAVETALEG